MATTTKATAPRKSSKAPLPAKDKAATAPVRRMSAVPPWSKWKHYVQRRVRGVSDFILFDAAKLRGENVLLEGPTQSGKTMALYAWAAKRGLHVAFIASNAGASPEDLLGDYYPDGKGGFVWVDGPVTDIARYGGLILGNEINFLPEEIKTIMFALLDQRRQLFIPRTGELIRLHDGGADCWCDEREEDDEGRKVCKKGVLVAADMNPGYYGTHEMNHAFRLRFQHVIQWDYDTKVEMALVPYPALHDMVSQIRASNEYETPTGTGMLKQFVEDYRYFGMEYAENNFIDKYSADEREPLRHVFNAHRPHIEKDLRDIEPLTPLGDAVLQPNREVGLPGRGKADYRKNEWGYDGDVEDDDVEWVEASDDSDEPQFDYAEES